MANRRDLFTWTDRQLWDVCQIRPWERAAENTGCGFLIGLWLAAIVASVVLLISGQRVVFLTVAASLAAFTVLSPLLIAVCLSISGFRSRHHRTELAKRWGQGTLSEYLQSSQQLTATNGGPTWVLIFQGSALPHGGAVWSQITLWEHSDPHGEIESRVSPFIGRYTGQVPPLAQFELARAQLTLADAQSLLNVLHQALATPNRVFKDTVRDGFDCSFGIVDRTTQRVLSPMNLAGLDPADESHPHVALVQHINRLAAAISEKPVIIGSFNPRTGKIGIQGRT